ncbi:MAG: hypothetical protein JWO10_1027 [Microbacteriaceae bacterium]|nr:hypothetical protein [Microbacteriaceae bacterium]
MTSVTRRAAFAAAALALVAVLAGCVGIPGSSSVNQGLAIAQDSSGANFEFNPEGPTAGASQQDILRGFVAAFTSSTGGYAVAKQYLSDEFASKWDPRQSVLIRSGVPRLLPIDSATMEYDFTTVATVDSAGSYTEATQSSSLRFGFTKASGQWRISAAPSGIVLSQETFKRIFSKNSLYFLDPTSQRLVPDLRWFPSGTAATRIVSALLDGPPAWLEGAVRTEFPDGTKLSDAGSLVTVDSGVARVDLTREALAANARERQLMLLQLSESLRTVANISSVSISVQGAALAIDDLAGTAPDTNEKVDSQALVLLNGEFGYYANGKVASLSQLGSRVVELSPTAATLSSDGISVAVLGPAGVSVVRKGQAAATLVDGRPGLIAPSLDEYGYVWTVPSGNPNAVIATGADGVAHNVAPGLPLDSQVRSFEVSRDGARVAVLLSTATGPRLIVAAILRDPKQVPSGLGSPVLDVPIDAFASIDATWVDELTVAALTQGSTGAGVQLFVIGGESSSLGTLASAQDIVGGNGLDGLRVLGNDHVVSTYRGSSWQGTGVKVDLVATQR